MQVRVGLRLQGERGGSEGTHQGTAGDGPTVGGKVALLKAWETRSRPVAGGRWQLCTRSGVLCCIAPAESGGS